MEQEFINFLYELEETDEYEKIIQKIKKTPINQLPFEIKKILGRAYNKTEKFKKALKILLSEETLGREDASWNYSVGYAYYYLKNYEIALVYFNRSSLLGDHTAKTYEKWCLNEVYNKKWYKITLNAVELISKNNGNWSTLSNTEQEVVAIYLLGLDMTFDGFLVFFCNWGYTCYSNALKGLIKTKNKKKETIIKKQFKIINRLHVDSEIVNLEELPKMLSIQEHNKLKELDKQYLEVINNLPEKVFEVYADFFKNYAQNNQLKSKNINVKDLNLDLDTKH